MILKELEKYLSKSDNQKSSHWKKELQGADYFNTHKSFGFGWFEKKSILHIHTYPFFFPKINI